MLHKERQRSKIYRQISVGNFTIQIFFDTRIFPCDVSIRILLYVQYVCEIVLFPLVGLERCKIQSWRVVVNGMRCFDMCKAY